ncbi:MAG: hypothetical protein HEP70_04960 [Rhodobiaceae bacterium]|nr:hypothetical protein [Rhodobiaceae bacterium]
MNERSWANGKYMLMGVLRPGWALKVAASWDGYEHPHGLSARVDSTVILIPRTDFLDAVLGNADIVRQITDFFVANIALNSPASTSSPAVHCA